MDVLLRIHKHFNNTTVPIGDEAQAAKATGSDMFSLTDIILVIFLLGITVWWWFYRNKKDGSLKDKSYAIQPMVMTSTPQVTDNSFIKKLKSSGRSLIVFYGSQTGTGEEFAGRIAKEGIRYQLKGMVADPEEYDMEELTQLKNIPNSLAVFCMATYGEGDPTDNAMEFVEWLQNGEADLTGLNYTIFGLGNKTYEHYNEVAIYIDKRMEELGATRVYQLGLGDDDANIEDDFITWKDGLWPTVCEFFSIEASGEEFNMRQYRVTEHDKEALPDRIYTGEIARIFSYKNQKPPYDMKNPFLTPVRVNRELHKGGDRSCMHIEFDLEGSKLRYDSGDHAAVYPENRVELVNRIGELLEVDLDTVFTLTNTDEDSSKRHPFPCPTSYRTALTYYVDISGKPRTHVLKELAEYASDPKEAAHLKMMASTSPEGKQLYNQWIVEDNRSIVHVLEDMKSVKPKIDHLCELLPRLQCRYYSISSSGKLHPNRVHITAVRVEYDTPTNRHVHGVATSWLAEKIPKGDGSEDPVVPLFIRKSQFKLPTKTQTPIIMIGPGTGLAPFRGFIQERDMAKKEGKPVGETILYFGCRKKSEDFIYEEELNEFVQNGSLKMYVAFSRDQAEKVYVTHLLSKNADEIWNVIGLNNGHFYICGDARSMAKDVQAILLKVIQEKGNMSEKEAQAFFKKMESQKRYSADVWS
ncbi:NADPH--cytochrome P450 reductase isoform X1 [Halyomorpha halys]|uniref:NADPH--cytochrome P450 reductase isoform X1 n=2 Tax=Halyomorpha halys TaxID=286706 RepID=UPI0006D52743|nr:NADPH--cytochrome P450 reductase isoform X1 [Halyomorpha halys]